MEEENIFLGEDGLKYCSICKEAKEAYYPENSIMEGRTHPRQCRCEREERDNIQHYYEEKDHEDLIRRNKSICFEKKEMYFWTFGMSLDDGSVFRVARRYVSNWKEMKRRGYLFWGTKGCGKSYLAGCIANALIEKGVTVKMVDFNGIFRELAHVREQEEYIKSLMKYELLIIDGFEVEQNAKSTLGDMLSILDYRFQTRRPLIVTTRIPLIQFQTERDFMKRRIYNRILDMCIPMNVDIFPERSVALKF